MLLVFITISSLQHLDSPVQSAATVSPDMLYKLSKKIAQLTKVTHDKMTHSKMVFEVIRNRMYSALAQQLLPVMYLINLIVKNHPVPFELLFQSRIASDFCIAMKDSIPADDRSYFYNLRSTWPLLYNNQAHSF